MVERLVSARTKENEEEVEQTLRPQRLAEYIGQEKLKEHVQIMLEAAMARGEVLDHSGPQGTHARGPVDGLIRPNNDHPITHRELSRHLGSRGRRLKDGP